MKKLSMNNLDYEKKKKIRLIAIIVLIIVLNALLIWVLATNSGNQSAENASADETEHQTEVPEGYTAITNVDGLKAMSLSGKYILMNDIDLAGTTWDVLRNIFFISLHRNIRWK